MTFKWDPDGTKWNGMRFNSGMGLRDENLGMGQDFNVVTGRNFNLMIELINY